MDRLPGYPEGKPHIKEAILIYQFPATSGDSHPPHARSRFHANLQHSLAGREHPAGSRCFIPPPRHVKLGVLHQSTGQGRIA